MGEEGLDLSGSEPARVHLVMKEDVAARPVDIGLFSSDAVVLDAQSSAHLIEKAGRRPNLIVHARHLIVRARLICRSRGRRLAVVGSWAGTSRYDRCLWQVV
jgi:hypothetical protein